MSSDKMHGSSLDYGYTRRTLADRIAGTIFDLVRGWRFEDAARNVMDVKEAEAWRRTNDCSQRVLSYLLEEEQS